jgi:fumarate hydratase class II
MRRLQVMNESIDDLDKRLHQATIDAGEQVLYKAHDMNFRIHTRSTGSLRRSHLYVNKNDSDVIIFVANTDYNNCNYRVELKSTDPAITEQLQPLVEHANALGKQYSNLLSQYRMMEKLSV